MRTIAASLLFCAVLSPALARADAGLAGGSTLARPLGARASGMGEAFVSVDGGIDSLGYNAAGISTATRPAVQTTYTRGIVDDYFSYAAYVQPLPVGVLAIGAEYYDAGNIHLTLSDGTDRFVKAQQDYVEMLAYGVELAPGLAVGAVAKVFQLNLGQQAHAQGYAGDAGVLWRSPVHGLNLGASAQNLGPNVKFESASDSLPATYLAGASYLLDLERIGYRPEELPNFFSKFLFSGDVILIKDQAPAGAAGIEMDMPFSKAGHVLLRAGYLFNRDIDGLTIGVGFKEGRFIADYAVGLEKTLGDVHRFSIGFTF